MFAKFRNLFSSSQVNTNTDDNGSTDTTENNQFLDNNVSHTNEEKKENNLRNDVGDQINGINSTKGFEDDAKDEQKSYTHSKETELEDLVVPPITDNDVDDKNIQSYCSIDDISYATASENLDTLNSHTSMLHTAPEMVTSETVYLTMDEDQESMVDVEEIRSQSVTPTPSDNDLIQRTSVDTLLAPIEKEMTPVQSPDKVYIKLVELEPKLLTLGKNFEDSLSTQQAYNDILRNVKNLPGPLDEFILKAETLLAERQLSPELANIMADTLSDIWDNVLNVLECNQQILVLCTQFHDKMKLCRLSMNALREACTENIPTEITMVQQDLHRIKHLRINMLTTLMEALKQGNELLEQLKELENSDTLDMWPEHFKREAKHAIHEVQEWLEGLHDSRNEIEALWHKRKSQLEECLSILLWSRELDDLELSLKRQKQQVSGVFSLGECADTVNNTLKFYEEWKHEGFILRDQALKLTRVIEKLHESGDLGDYEGCTRAYVILGECTEHLELIIQREHWLQQANTFFTKSNHILSVLEKFEIDLSNINNFPLHSKVFNNILNFTDETLKLGNDILEEMRQNQWESHEIERILAEIENRKAYILSIYAASQDNYESIQTSVTNFQQQYDDILLWLTDYSQSYLQGQMKMGTDLQQSKHFLLQHHEFMQDLEVNGELINKLIESVKTNLESFTPNERYSIDIKAENLHQHWKDLKQIVIVRVNVVTLLIDFFEKADELANQLDNLQRQLAEKPDNKKLEFLQESWSEIRNNFGELKHLGLLFNNAKAADPYLNKEPSENAVKQVFDNFGKRQMDIEVGIENWTTTIKSEQEIEIILEKILDDNKQMYAKTINVDMQLYPVFNNPSMDGTYLQNIVTEKLELVINDIEKAQDEILKRMESTLSIQTNDAKSLAKIENVISNLEMLKSKLDIIKNDYKTLINNVLDFLKNIVQLHTDIFDFFRKLPEVQNTAPIENAIHQHELFYNSTMDKFKVVINKSEILINQLRSVEPTNAADIDTDVILKLLEKLRIDFETKDNEEVSTMKESAKFEQFKKDLFDINHSLDSVGEQLKKINNQSIESLVEAKTTSLAFEYFERTVELLQARVDKFVDSEMLIGNPKNRSYYEEELKKLTVKWNNFKDLVKQKRNSLNQIFEFFGKFEKIEAEYNEISYFFNSISRKIQYLKDSVEADNLLSDIDDYVKNRKDSLLKQLDDASKYDNEKVSKLSNDIKSLFELIENIKLNIISAKDSIKSNETSEILTKDSLTKNEASVETLGVTTQIQPQSVVEKKDIIEKTEHISSMEIMLNKINEHNINITKSNNVEVNNVVVNTPPRFISGLKNTIAHEGEKCIFECKVTGNPSPTVEWYKDGISIYNNSDYKTTNDNGLCTLIIEETFIADAAKFVCTASNLMGTSQTEANLTVLENVMETHAMPPCFIKLLNSCFAQEGVSVEFSCAVVGKPLPTIKWYKNDVCIDESPKYIINYNNGEATLRIAEVLLEDDAIYTCSASNQAGIEHSSASLKIQPNDSITKPFFTVPLNNAMARVGQKVKLEAVVDGKPSPDIFWFHNSKPYSPRQLKYMDGHVTLIIPQAYPNDSGEYTLAAKNIAGESFNSCTVIVKGRLPNETSDSEMGISDIEPIKPSIQLPLKDAIATEGKTVCLTCVIIGQPEPEVIWYHNDRPIKESSEMQLLFQGDRCSLIINEVYEEDAGNYKVIAINSAGEAACQCQLTVTPPDFNEQYKVESITLTEKSPTFEKRLKNIDIFAGETIILDVIVTGDQPLISKWYLNNTELMQNDRTTILADPLFGAYKLIISDANSTDEGIYAVKIFNRSGVSECFSQVKIKHKIIEERIKEQESRNMYPEFEAYFTDMNAKIGEMIKFQCIVKGIPTPSVHWLFNNQPVRGPNFIVNSIGEQHTMTIANVGLDTVGKITCVAENTSGKSSCEAYLYLTDSNFNKDNELGGSKLKTITKEDSTQSSCVSFQKETFTTTTSSQMNTHQGSLPQIELNYLKDIEKKFPEPPETLEYTTIKEVHKTDEMSHPIIKHDDVTLPFEKTSSIHQGENKCPNFITPLKSQVVQSGADVNMEVLYTGFPEPQIEIKKNGIQLYTNDRIKLESNNKRINLIIHQVSEFDEGRYTITATNSVGQSTTTADLIIKQTTFPPTFERRLQAQVVKVNEAIVMEVQVIGMPKPVITWMKDNKPLNEAGISTYFLSQDNNSYKLTIEKGQLSDSGKYMVKASNASGEAESIADCAVLKFSSDRMEIINDSINELPKVEQKIQQYDNSTRHGISESKIVTEHSSTTKATMHLKHISTNNDIPQLSQRPITPSTTNISTPININDGQHRTTTTIIRESSLPTYMKSSSTTTKQIKSQTPISDSNISEYNTLRSQISDLSEIFARKNQQRNDLPKSNDELDGKVYVPSNNLQAPLLVNKINKDQSTKTTNIEEIKLVPGSPPEILFMPNFEAHDQVPKITKQDITSTSSTEYKNVKQIVKNINTFPVIPCITTPTEPPVVVVTPPPIKFGTFSPINKHITPPIQEKIVFTTKTATNQHINNEQKTQNFESCKYVASPQISSPSNQTNIRYHLRQKSDPMIYYNAIVGIPLHTTKPIIENRKFERMENHKNITITRESNQFTLFHSNNNNNVYLDNANTTGASKLEKSTMSKDVTDCNYSNMLRDIQITPTWTLHANRGLSGFRHVEPPRSRSCSVPHTYERVLSPMEFDRGPQMSSGLQSGNVCKKSFEKVITQNISKTLNRHSSSRDYNICIPTSDRIIHIELPLESDCYSAHICTDNTSPIHKYRDGSEVAEYGVGLSSEIPVNAHLNRDFYLKQAPFVITHLKNIAVNVMQSARFECIFQANPSPNIIWSKNDNQLLNSEKYMQVYRNGVCRLTIRNTSPDDAGIYICTAMNCLGTVTTSGQLTVTTTSPLIFR